MPNCRLHCRLSPRDYDRGWLQFFETNGLVPEIYFVDNDLEDGQGNALGEIADWLKSRNLRPSLHAPIGSGDPVVLDDAAKNYGRRMTGQIAAMARKFDARVVVFHPVFDKYSVGKKFPKWVEENLDFFEGVLNRTAGLDTTIAVENIFSDQPDPIAELISDLGSERFRFCFDVGHFNKYSSVGLSKWFKLLGDRICEIHVHDNFGKHDEHLPPGEGNFPFKKLVDFINSVDRELILTIETVDREAALRAVGNLKGFLGIE
ncbi:MAG: sugar phosphate isomerase/epimerase family protein [Pseudomonadota bacterium]